MNRVRGIGVMTVLVAMVAAGCGGGSGSSSAPEGHSPTPVSPAAASSASAGTPAPEPSTRPAAPFPATRLSKAFRSVGEMPLDIALGGAYRTSSFLPPFSFEGPQLAYPFFAHVDDPDLVFLSSGSPEGAITFVRPNGVYQQGTHVVDVPADLGAWLRENPYLRVGPASAVSMGGLHGTQMDAVVAAIPPGPSACSDGDCLRVASTSDDFVAYFSGEKVRFFVLDAGHTQLLVSIDAAARDFGPFSGNAKRLLNTVRFEGV